MFIEPLTVTLQPDSFFSPHLCTFHLCCYTNRITNLCPWPSSNILNFPSLPLSSLVAALQFLYSEKRVVEETSTVGSANNGHSHLTEANSLLSACFFHKLLLPFSPPPLLCLSHHSSPRLHFISFLHSLPTLPSLQTLCSFWLKRYGGLW